MQSRLSKRPPPTIHLIACHSERSEENLHFFRTTIFKNISPEKKEYALPGLAFSKKLYLCTPENYHRVR
jgi:hypothetical protein